MSQIDRHPDELLPWYVNSTLETHERRQVEAHVARCERCRVEVESLKAAYDGVGRLLDAGAGPSLDEWDSHAELDRFWRQMDANSVKGGEEEQTPSPQAAEFADNPELRFPCVFILDTSGSMRGARIAALNERLQELKRDIGRNRLASRRTEVAIITFDDDARVAQSFVTVDGFRPPTLTAQGSTDLNGGIEKALDLLEKRTATYRKEGIQYFLPWVFLITDNEIQEGLESATRRILDMQARKRIVFYAAGVGDDADTERLSRMVVDPEHARSLQEFDLQDMFKWIASSITFISTSQKTLGGANSPSEQDGQIECMPADWGRRAGS